MILKRSTIIISVAIGLILLTAVSFTSFNYKKDYPMETVNIHADLAKEYTRIEDLKNDSEIIVEVRASEVKSFDHKNIIFTLTKAEVLNIYKGQAVENINILETGGIQNNTNYTFFDNKVFEKNDTALLFLDKYVGPIVDDAYVILGAYQGKFLTNGDKITIPNEIKGELKNIKTISDFEL